MGDLAPVDVLVLDEGQAETSLDALAAAVAVFGRGTIRLLYAHHRSALPDMADRCGADIIVVDVDRDPRPKDILADVVEAGPPVVVVTDGRDDSVPDHALSVGASACLQTSMPARDLVAHLVLVANRGAAWRERVEEGTTDVDDGQGDLAAWAWRSRSRR
jgi:DNA-binding NarL/FixJ family response regulator